MKGLMNWNRQTPGCKSEIAERKRSEEALRIAWVYNRSLIEASLDPLVTIGPDGKITDISLYRERNRLSL